MAIHIAFKNKNYVLFFLSKTCVVFNKIKDMYKQFLSFFIFILFVNNLSAQTPFIRNFSPEEYKTSGQNWSIVQDHRGIMYFANNNGVLEYDGTTWRGISTQSRVRSLCIDSTGVIYVGLENDFGFLKTNSTGILTYSTFASSLKY